MNVAELFRRLSLSELSNLALANDGDGTIKDTAKPKMILHANTALQKLYGRFMLREKTLLIQTLTYKTTYVLSPEFAMSNHQEGSATPCYIVDSAAEPFIGDVVRILDAQESTGKDLTVNNASDPLSIHTPTPNTVQIPSPLSGQAVALNYQADHTDLLDDDEEQEICLPEVLHKALTTYIGYEIYSGMTSNEAVARAEKFLMQYEMICSDVEARDLVGSSRTSNDSKFDERGFM